MRHLISVLCGVLGGSIGWLILMLAIAYWPTLYPIPRHTIHNSTYKLEISPAPHHYIPPIPDDLLPAPDEYFGPDLLPRGMPHPIPMPVPVPIPPKHIVPSHRPAFNLISNS